MATGTTRLLQRAQARTSLATLIDLYIASKQVEGKSQRTLDWYRANLQRFNEFLNPDGDAMLEDLSLQSGRAFVAHLQSLDTRYGVGTSTREEIKGGLSPHTVHGYVRTLKAFGSWLLEEGFVAEHPFVRLQRPKLPKTMIDVLSEQEIQQIFAAINVDSYLGARLQAIVLLLLDTGIRATELCTLTLENTYLEQSYVKVTGKGDKERMVPFGTTTRKSLLRYVHAYRPEPASPDVDQLILSIYGRPLVYDGLAQIIRRLGERTGIRRLRAHLFRHTFAVRYLMNGGDIMTLRIMLGHSTLEVTQVYLHLAQAHVHVQHSKFSPVDQLGLGQRGRRRGRKGTPPGRR